MGGGGVGTTGGGWFETSPYDTGCGGGMGRAPTRDAPTTTVGGRDGGEFWVRGSWHNGRGLV